MRQLNLTTRGARAAILIAGLLMPSPLLAQSGPSAAPVVAPQPPAPLTPVMENPKARATLSLLLSAHHELPARERFDALGARVDHALASVARDTTTFPLQRYRALEALGTHYPGTLAAQVYAEALRQGDDEGLVHRLLLWAPQLLGARALPMVTPYLSHDDVQLRLSAATGLEALREHAPARQAANARLDVEADAQVRAQLNRVARELR